jgi:DNA polymerase I-like protein with 3'-5' exonuclease and polymerase domains
MNRHYTLLDDAAVRRTPHWHATLEQIVQEIRRNGGIYSIDTETSSLNPFERDFKLVGFVLATTPEHGYYLPLAHTSDGLDESYFIARDGGERPRNVSKEHVLELLDRLNNERFRAVYHNSAFDRIVLKRTLGVPLEQSAGEDTILIAHLLDENDSLSLKSLAQRYLGVQEELPKVTQRELDEGLDERLFDELVTTATAKNGRAYKKRVRRLRPDWEACLEEYAETFSGGALPYQFVMQLVGRSYALMKKHGEVTFEGSWSGDFRHVPIGMAMRYACDDTMNTLALYALFRDVYLDLEPELLRLYEEVERPVNDVMTAATERGIKVDSAYLSRTKRTLLERAEEIYEEALKSVREIIPKERKDEFNLDTLMTSAPQLATLLYDVVGFAVPERTPSGAPSASKTALKKLLEMRAPHKADKAKEFIRKKLEYQDVNKLLTTYTDSLLELVDDEGRIHPWYKIFGTVSGRMSCAEPNFQQMPRLTPEEIAKKPWLYGIDIRAAFHADDDYVFVSADWSGMEMAVGAGVSGDEALIQLLAEGRDLHVYTGKQAILIVHEQLSEEHFEERFGMSREAFLALDDSAFKESKTLKPWRQDAKVVNFSQLYAGTWWTLHKAFGFPEAKARMLEQAFKRAYPGLTSWMERVYEELNAHGEVRYPEYGYVKRMDVPDETLRFHDPRAYERQYQAALRTCLNALIQGYSAFIAKEAVVKTARELQRAGLNAQVMYQIHDEIGLMVHRNDALRAQEILVGNMRRHVGEVFLNAEPELKHTMSKSERPLTSASVLSNIKQVTFKALSELADDTLVDDESDQGSDTLALGVRRVRR